MENNTYKTSINGIKVPWLIYGTAWKKENTTLLVEKAIKKGFRGIDTAGQPKHYQEDLVGVALHNLFKEGFKREDIYLQTKFTPLSGQGQGLIPYDIGAPIEDQVRQSFEASKKNLQTSYVDAYILHSPLQPYATLMKVWNAMQDIFNKKEALELGISNCYNLDVLKQLYAHAKIKPAIVQNRFHQESKYDAELRLWCDSKGIIYQSFWSLTANPHILNNELVLQISRHYKKTSEQIFFRYLTQCEIVPLTGTWSSEHMQEDLSILDFTLSKEEVISISDLLKLVYF